MTDEEIEQARKNIEYDKYEKAYADQWAAIKNNSEFAPKMGSWSVIRNHFFDESLTDEWEALGDYYRRIGLG